MWYKAPIVYCYNSGLKILKIHKHTFFYKHLKFKNDFVVKNL